MTNYNTISSSTKRSRKAYDLCMEITQSLYTPILCRAWAYYYMGLVELHNARHSGDLQLLWKDHSIGYKESASNGSFSNGQSSESIHLAQKHFKDALAIIGPASQLLSRNVMRSLALVSGPIVNDVDFGSTAAVLIHSSIGSTARQAVSRGYGAADGKSSFRTSEDVPENIAKQDGLDHRIREIFDVLDIGFYNPSARSNRIRKLFCEANRLFPPNWRFVAASLCPTGELLLTSAVVCSQDETPTPLSTYTVCIFPDDSESQVHDEILRPLDDLIRRNQQQLGGMDNEKVSEQFSEESAKQRWWRERQDINDQLELLLERVGTKYFGVDCIKRLFLDTDMENDHILDINCNFDVDESPDLSCGNLASKFEEAYTTETPLTKSPFGRYCTDTSDPEECYNRKRYEKLTVAEIKDKLNFLEVGSTKYRKLRKAELIDLLLVEKEKRNSEHSGKSIPTESTPLHCTDNQSDTSLDGENATRDECLFLILDENLHRFPFEGMDFLSDKAVSRIPSLPFAMAVLKEAEEASKATRNRPIPFVDPSGTSYVIDPEANLSETTNRLVPVIEKLFEKNQWHWNGVVGTMPSSTFVEDALMRKNGLFLYCGHGGARSIFSRRQVESLLYGTRPLQMQVDSAKNRLAHKKRRKCRSAVILMGCSSGKLVSVNRKDSDSSENMPIFYEPEGIVLSYLCAGAPCVVGNLWDVTDRDIDR